MAQGEGQLLVRPLEECPPVAQLGHRVDDGLFGEAGARFRQFLQGGRQAPVELDACDHLDRIHRLDEEVVGPRLERPPAPVGVSRIREHDHRQAA